MGSQTQSAARGERSYPSWEKWRSFLLSQHSLCIDFYSILQGKARLSSWREWFGKCASLRSNLFILQHLGAKCHTYHSSETDSGGELAAWVITMLPDHWEPWWVPGNHWWSFSFRGEVHLFLSHPGLSWIDAKRCNPLICPQSLPFSTHPLVIEGAQTVCCKMPFESLMNNLHAQQVAVS